MSISIAILQRTRYQQAKSSELVCAIPFVQGFQNTLFKFHLQEKVMLRTVSSSPTMAKQRVRETVIMKSKSVGIH